MMMIDRRSRFMGKTQSTELRSELVDYPPAHSKEISQ